MEDKLTKKLQEAVLKGARKLERNNWSTEGFREIQTFNKRLLRKQLEGEDIKDIDIYTKQHGVGFNLDKIVIGNMFVEVEIFGSGEKINNIYIRNMDKIEKRGRKTRGDKGRDRVKLLYSAIQSRYHKSPEESLHQAIVHFTGKLR